MFGKPWFRESSPTPEMLLIPDFLVCMRCEIYREWLACKHLEAGGSGTLIRTFAARG
jgi:hypothetical protein